MKKYYFLIFCIIILFLVNCKKGIDLSMPSPEQQKIDIVVNPYIGKYWQCLKLNSEFEARELHSLVVFNNKLWLIGGRDYNLNYFADVWRSDNGIDWKCVTKNANFGSRSNAYLCNFKNNIYLIGGISGTGNFLNDVWRSDNGVDWSLVTGNADFSPRIANFINFNNEFYIIGGYTGITFKSEVWKSNNGKDWQLIKSNAAFGESVFNGVVVFKNKIWAIAGLGKEGASYVYKYDVWSSSNGIDWDFVTKNSIFSDMSFSNLFVYDKYIYLIKSIYNSSGSGMPYYNEIWRTEDGKNWVPINLKPDFSSRHTFSTIIFNDKFYLIGGHFGYGYGDSNDIWISE